MCKGRLLALALALLNSEAELYLPVWTSIIVCHTFLSGTPSAVCCRGFHGVSHCCNNSSTLGLPVSLPLCFWRCTRQVQPFCNCHWTVPLKWTSGPLSHLIFFGLPFSQITFSNVFITLLAEKDIETSTRTPPPYHCHPLCSAPELPSALQDITNKIQRPCRIGFRRAVPKVSWPLPEVVSSNGHVSRSAYSCTHGKPSCGSNSFLHAWDVWISSRIRLRIGLLSLSLLQLQCHLASPDNSNTNGGSPSACTPERCSIRIPQKLDCYLFLYLGL